MSRLSREKKREHKRAARSAASMATPIAVHVPADGAGASVGGVPVLTAPGEEIQHAVLNHLHRLALATGQPVLATVTDERIGYVVPLRVHGDGSSIFTAEPLRTAPPEGPGDAPWAGGTERRLEPTSLPAAPGRTGAPGSAGLSEQAHASGEAAVFAQVRASGEAGVSGQAEVPASPAGPEPADAPAPPQAPAPASPQASVPAPSQAPAPAAESSQSSRDKATHVLQQVPEPVRESAPTFPLRAVPEPQPLGEAAPTFPLRAVPEPQPFAEPAPTFALRAVPESAEGTAPGTVAAPTGEFGPPPVMDARPADAKPADAKPADARSADARSADARPVEAKPAPPVPTPTPARKAQLPTAPLLHHPDPEPEPDPKPTPARGFDAVAEAVLGDDPRTTAGEGGTVLLAEPMARINEAVKAGRIEAAADLAERTVTEASGTLGPEHPEVLRLRELTAYIAYLAGDPLRSFGLSLDLARIRRRARDAEAAYGNIQSAAAAWRAVRDPEQGLRLGRDLIGLWTELTAEDGPAADDIEQLESARARMGRLAERARKAASPPTS
ncbi:tetratricopeptide repeat protein [Streptomyces sp. NPDC005202]|uniref:tetratricopeptide repeat protein n=1 Tax=Streptomyces sp. NPDC005202 TaxID=3157021 RepID=UPI0033B68490